MSSSSKGVALVIPCFNEAKRLPVSQLLEHGDLFSAIVFVNDGSTDNTASVLNETASTLTLKSVEAYVHNMETNAGKGEAVRQGVQLARLRYPDYEIAITDADLSTPLPEMARLAAERARRDADILQGARVALAGKTIVRSRTRHWMGRICQTLMSELLNLDIYDTQAGAKVFRGDAADNLFKDPFLSHWLFDCEVFLRARQLGYCAEEEPLHEWRQVDGSSVSPWTYARALGELLRIVFHYRRGPL